MSDDTPKAIEFDPLALFPCRVKDRIFTAYPQVPGGCVAGSTDLINGKVYLPLGNNYYDRQVRCHEAKHAIYSTAPTSPLTILDQALEDSYIHNLANYTGLCRQEEIMFAEYDLKQTLSKEHEHAPRELKALIDLRIATILNSHGGKDVSKASHDLLKKSCEQIAPDYYEQVLKAVAQVAAGDRAGAETTLLPYFGTPQPPEPPRGPGREPEPGQPGNEPQPPQPPQPPRYKVPPAIPEKETLPGTGKVKSKEDKEASKAKREQEKRSKEVPKKLQITFDRIEGKITTEAADMLSGTLIGEIGSDHDMPTMHIVPLYASDMIQCKIGENETRNSRSGYRIDVSRLASLPTNPNVRLFTKDAHVNGGTILIDASGSMRLTVRDLQQIVQDAPAATVGFYNGSGNRGNLWIYAYKGRRAADLSKVSGWSGGNEIDFPALQWLLKQDRPRIFMTDMGFCGRSYTASRAARELFQNAIARKLVTQAVSHDDLLAILKRGGY